MNFQHAPPSLFIWCLRLTSNSNNTNTNVTGSLRH
jgi:hypothetical protein